MQMLKQCPHALLKQDKFDKILLQIYGCYRYKPFVAELNFLIS